MVLCFFHPDYESDPVLRQCLSIFFPAFAFSSQAHQLLLESTFLPVIRGALYSAPDSPLREVPVNTIAQFLVYLTDASNLQQKPEEDSAVSSSHDRIPVLVAFEILANPTGAEGN
jgi:condensin complex subunit 3